jgi:uncharacterized protein (UPF0548 family)
VRNFGCAEDLPERISSIALGVRAPVAQWRTEFLFDYRVFPPWLMRFKSEWSDSRRPMAVGDVIVQRPIFPPIGGGICLQFAVRVIRRFTETDKIGFAYETLEGHAESGVSEFFIEERDGALFFTIHTFSQPAHWSSRLVRYIFSEPYQAWCTDRALAFVRAEFRRQNSLNG